jgi:hypothetical protein
MYYEEKAINGVLHWRGTPEGQWIAKTAEQLTEMLLTARVPHLDCELPE